MIEKIKKELRENEDKINYILKELGCRNIHKSGDYIRFGIDDEGSGSANSINISTLSYKTFSRDISGDIIVLVSFVLKIKTGESIRWLAKKLNLSFEYTQKNETGNLPFGGFWRELSSVKKKYNNDYKVYNDSVYEEFNTGISKMFIKDNISIQTQEFFEVGFDILTNRITIRWRDYLGKLVGVMGRVNKHEIGDKENKYFPIIAFDKRNHLFGYYENYENFYKHNCVIIVESEKSVMKAYQFGFKNVVAIGSSILTDEQANLIKSLHLDVIFALDEGVEIEHMLKQAEKVKIKNPFFENEVYILDMEDQDKKTCIFDKLKIEEIKECFRTKLIYYEKKEVE